jgi:5'-phosphate synthase pdxT subunit
VARIGILALQGGFAAHGEALARLGHDAFPLRDAADLDAADGLVLPGGESSAQLTLLARFALEEPLARLARAGKPVLATCAGLILIAHHVSSPEQRSFDWIDVDVIRNAYGRQRDSFEATDDGGKLPLVFIRAPRIARAGSGVEVLATLGGEPILVRQGNVVGATFHPELTPDETVHRLAFGSAGLPRRSSSSSSNFLPTRPKGWVEEESWRPTP